MADEAGEILHGGVANAGAVVRVGDEVVRPAAANGPTVHRFLRHLASTGLDIAPVPIAWDAGGRERLRFIPGTVAIPPYPAWAQSGEALASMATLIRSLHDASRTFERDDGDVWSSEIAGAEFDRPVICHNDVCLENVVFRDGAAVALLDFEFAAPGLPSCDLAGFARMCVPIDDEVNRARLGWQVTELPHRFRLIADSYDCTATEREAIVAALEPVLARHEAWVRTRAEAGDPGVVAMWEASGGAARFDRRRSWWDRHRQAFADAMS